MGPGTMSPSRVPWVTSCGSERAIIIWYFISQKESFPAAVLPQWKPIKTSLCSYGNFVQMSCWYKSFGTVLLMSSRVTVSWLTTLPINSLSAP